MTWWKQGVEYFFVSGLKTSQKLVAEAELWININKFFPLFCMLSSTLIKLKHPKCYEHQEKNWITEQALKISQDLFMKTYLKVFLIPEKFQ